MRVLVNCLSATSGGAITYMSNLLPRLNDLFVQTNGRDELVFLVNQRHVSLLRGQIAEQNLIIPDTPLEGAGRLWWEYRRLNPTIRRHRINVLFVPYQLTAKAAGVKTVLMLRNMEPFLYDHYQYSRKSRLRNYLLRRQTIKSLRRADRIIAVSDFVKNYCLETMSLNSQRLCRIYHGRDEFFAPSDQREHPHAALNEIGLHGDFVFTCGSLLPYRRCEDVIHAFAKSLAAEQHDATLVIAGTGSDKPYQKHLRRVFHALPSRRQVRLLGHVSKEQMRFLYQNCRLFVTATEIEACPNIALEALSSGCVILAGDTTVLQECFRNAAEYFEPRNIEDLAQKMRRLWMDDMLAEQYRRNAYVRAQDFSWDLCAHQTFRALIDW